MQSANVSLIIPVLNEVGSIVPLLQETPFDQLRQVIVVDNGSTDGTADAARQSGALVVNEQRRGYGYACLAGAMAAESELLVFMDGDGSFIPAELERLLEPLQNGSADLVLGSRLLAEMPPGAMPAHQLWGNQLVARLVNWRYKLHLTDLGPFRAISRRLLESLELTELTYGWTVEMMVKGACRGLRIVEVPVSYRPRYAGRSKIGANPRGTVLATWRIFTVVLRYWNR